MNYVASITLRSEPPPTGLQLTKWYFGPQVDRMKAQFNDAKELGAAAAEEWFKGLEKDGKEKTANAARWEQWELSGGFQAIADSISQLRRSQIPGGGQSLFPSEKQNNPGFETATMYGITNIRPTVQPQTHPWTSQGMQRLVDQFLYSQVSPCRRLTALSSSINSATQACNTSFVPWICLPGCCGKSLVTSVKASHEGG